MAGESIEWLHGVRAQDPDKPWFVYFSTGCSHAPHHVPKEWADKYQGRFDQSWDRLREETFERQKRLGVVPADAELTPRNEAFPAWDSLDEQQKRLYARQMEVYAGYSENADHNVGRVLDAIAELGELEDTLVIWIWGDNGSSMEGTLTGSFNELTMQNGIPLTAEQQLALVQRYGGLEVWGSELIAPHFSAAWAWAGNRPAPLVRLRGHGHRPRQRPPGRPTLRRPVAVRLHRHRQEGRLRHQPASERGGRAGPARARPPGPGRPRHERVRAHRG
jgi:arylsulfatase A-like enzyme